MKTSKRVRKLPKTAAAMRKGELSSAKAEAIADAAKVAPESEDELLDGAEKKPLGAVARGVPEGEGGRRRQGAPADPEEPLRAGLQGRRRRVESVRARHGRCSARRSRPIWRPLIDAQFKLAKAEGREEPLAAYAFDALMELANLAAAPTSAEAPSRMRRRRSRSGRRRSIWR